MPERRDAPQHVMPWFPQDWLSSSLRGELALERDHLARLVYRELLDVLHARGGYLPRAEVAGACLVAREEAEAAISRLLATGRIQETEDGRLFNVRVLEGLAEARDFRAGRQATGAAGGRATAEKRTAEERSETARRAALARHQKHLRTAEHVHTDAEQMLTDAEQPAQVLPTDAQPPTPPPTPSPPPEERSSEDDTTRVSASADAGEPDPPLDPNAPEVKFARDFAKALHAAHGDAVRIPGEETKTFRKRWVGEARLLFADVGEPSARQVSRWLFRSADEDAVWWRPNVLSVAKFREKFATLRGRMEARGQPSARAGPLRAAGSPEDAVRRLGERLGYRVETP